MVARSKSHELKEALYTSDIPHSQAMRPSSHTASHPGSRNATNLHNHIATLPLFKGYSYKVATYSAVTSNIVSKWPSILTIDAVLIAELHPCAKRAHVGRAP